MRRHNFTINELLAVIAIIGVLAALLFPTLSIARERAKTANCAANQGQVSKILLDAMSRTKDHLASAAEDSGSGASAKKIWTTALYDRKILNSIDYARCTAFEYTNNDVTDAAARKEAYGVVIATDGKLNFASKKSRTTSDKQEISPNKLLLGGCAADKWGEGAKATAALDFSTNKLTAIHRGAVNVFFLDGSVLSLDDDVLVTSKIYYPKADNSEALPITGAMILSE